MKIFIVISHWILAFKMAHLSLNKLSMSKRKPNKKVCVEEGPRQAARTPFNDIWPSVLVFNYSHKILLDMQYFASMHKILYLLPTQYSHTYVLILLYITQLLAL